ncbi:MAG: hypothetical protein H6617_06515 [Bdellovibrionaceae bacterium]|nr:hypothetical protein [Pseudobdellovibrionaceae bacterium]
MLDISKRMHQQQRGTLHLIGLFSDADVHSEKPISLLFFNLPREKRFVRSPCTSFSTAGRTECSRLGAH